MISNQILQSTIDGLRSIARVELCVVDVDGKIAASTSEEMENCAGAAKDFAKSPADSQEVQGCQFFKVFDETQLEYILVAGGAGEDIYTIGKMAAFQIQTLLTAYKERFDKDNPVDVDRAVLLIEAEDNRDGNVLELVREGFGSNSRDFVTAVDENSVIIVKELAEQEGTREVDRTAEAVGEFLKKEGIQGVRIAYGTIVKEIKEVSRSYKEAKMALDVGKIFFDERDIIAYNELGIGRLIYQLPIPLCKMFIKEIFGGKSPDDFDEETLTTINKFFENSLNVSETSRQLFIHRNTLVYRLDKLQKSTGLDLRVFEDAITFKIALMVVKYMKYMETFEY